MELDHTRRHMGFHCCSLYLCHCDRCYTHSPWLLVSFFFFAYHTAKAISRLFWVWKVSTFLLFPTFDRAIFQVAKTWMFWFCLLAIVVTSLLPRFAIKFLGEYYRPSDVRIAREAEKLGTFRESQTLGVEMNQIGDPPRRWDDESTLSLIKILYTLQRK